jgi:hypothetical protein
LLARPSAREQTCRLRYLRQRANLILRQPTRSTQKAPEQMNRK